MSRKSVRTSVESLEKRSDGVVATIEVTSLQSVPEEFQKLRARGRALAATGFASSGGEIVSNANLREIGDLTEVVGEKVVETGRLSVNEYEVLVKVPRE